MFPYKTAVVTGASGGIGAEFAQALAARGCALLLVARSEDKLRALAAKLSAEHGVRVEVLAADLSLPDAGARVRAASDALGMDVDLLINNAGFGSMGRFDKLDLAREQQEIALNVAAVVDLAHAYLGSMRARRRGAIVNLASSAAFQPLPYMAVYAATKAFVYSFSDALWAENRGAGVHVMAVCPGPVETGFFEATGNPRTRQIVESAPILTTQAVVAKSIAALLARQRMLVPGISMKAVSLLSRLSPRALTIRLVERVSRS